MNEKLYTHEEYLATKQTKLECNELEIITLKSQVEKFKNEVRKLVYARDNIGTHGILEVIDDLVCISNETPAQCLAARDAEVARKAYNQCAKDFNTERFYCKGYAPYQMAEFYANKIEAQHLIRKQSKGGE